MATENRAVRTPHLAIQEFGVSAGDEWKPTSTGWLFVQIKSGVGYCFEKQGNMELPTGALLVLSQRADITIRASQLGSLEVLLFRVEPELLTGLLTLGEQLFLRSAAAQPEFARRLLPPEHSVAVKFREQCQAPGRRDLVFRLSLLNLFALAFAGFFEEQAAAQRKAPLDARERLKQLLEQTLAAEWLNVSFGELVQKMNCTPRHLSRLFRDIAGMSFREKQASIRLARAGELLRTTDSKVVDVALESGFQSLSLFNMMFRKRFGLSPGRWRKKRLAQPRRRAPAAKEVLAPS